MGWPWNKYNVGAPDPEGRSNWLSVAAAGDGDEESVMLGNQHVLVVYDVRSKIVRTVMGPLKLRENWNWEHVGVTRHVFKESLVQHACFGSSADLQFVHSWC